MHPEPQVQRQRHAFIAAAIPSEATLKGWADCLQQSALNNRRRQQSALLLALVEERRLTAGVFPVGSNESDCKVHRRRLCVRVVLALPGP